MSADAIDVSAAAVNADATVSWPARASAAIAAS